MMHLGDKQRGMEYFTRAVEIYPFDAHAYNNLGNLYLYEDQSKAVQYYRKGVEVDPGFCENYNGLGVVYNSMGKYEKAI